MGDPRTIGRYEILSELGRGAMGSVFLARDPAMDRTVALKTILAVALASDQSSEFRERFLREARAAGILAHPGIVPVFDVGEHEGLPFLVMEFVQGQTLAAALKNGQRPTLDRVCEIGQQLAEALGYAHRQGVIHRDIKPANILMTSREAYGSERPRITDFGVAKLMAGEITTTGQLLGTPAFMPPEQFTGQPIDGRTDLFSLGVILYWMAAGEQPFAGETMTSVSYKVVHTEPIPPSKLNPSIPQRMERVILKCLAKNPAERYQTGEELALDLAALRADAAGTSLRTATPMTAMSGGESEMTLDSHPSQALPAHLRTARAAVGTTVAPASVAASAAVAGAAPAEKKGSSGIAVAAVVALVCVAGVGGGWYKLHHRSQPQPTAAAAPVTVPAPTVVQPATEQSAAATDAANAGVTAAPTGATTPSSAAVPAAAPAGSIPVAKPSAGVPLAPKVALAPRSRIAAVNFDPKALDPKLNGRLKVDLGSLQTGFAFVLEMDGQAYFKGASGDKASYANLFVPPGVHEFRVTVSGGGVQKASSIVSAEFKAKKSQTLKVEIRTTEKSPTGSPQGLSADAQVIATLKDSSRFSL